MLGPALAEGKNPRSDLRRSAVAAAAVMAIGMGFGRFAYTGVYPVMVQEGVVNLHEGTLAASANYAGYLLGALLAARLSSDRSRSWVMLSVIASIACLIALACTKTPWIIISIRGAAGVFSALSMIAASQWLLQHKGHAEGAPLLFSGVGIGIFLSAEILAIAQLAGLGSFSLWLILGVSGAVLGVFALSKLDKCSVHLVDHAKSSGPRRLSPLGAWPLIAAYGLAGFGYIITATYLPMLVKTALGDINPVHVWATFGLGAAPSCYLWHQLHLRLGTHLALRANLLIQAIGVVLPALLPTALGYVGSALIVGGTFMGTVTIAMPAAKRVSHTVRQNLIAVMTAAYGIGQIVGPLLASYLFAASGSFDTSLTAAMCGLLLAALLSVRLPHASHKNRQFS